MLGLTLREEFLGTRHHGTAIELANEKNTGATQIHAADLLNLTYPTTDVISAIEATGLEYGQPITIIGERGQGKSHLLSVLHHALTSPDVTSEWLRNWGERLDKQSLRDIKLRPKMFVISESVHRQNYKFLWDILFERHPHGERVLGRWESMDGKRTDIPGNHLLLDMFSHTPTALILDEFQTWFEGLTNTAEHPYRSWAFNFIQILSEIAKEHPDKLLLIVSVRSGDTESYRQLHRVNPRRIDFKGPNAQKDRLHLLLHRLFENRMIIPEEQIEAVVGVHANEHLRLFSVPASEHQRVRRTYVESWPFAPHLMTLLEDQVLLSTHAQGTRDIIRILADVFKCRIASLAGTLSCASVITAADFRIDDEKCGIAALLDAVSNEHHANLRAIAQRNLDCARGALKDPSSQAPHLAEIMSSLWVRSLAVNNAGADKLELQRDITRYEPHDDNAFLFELGLITENSFNVHKQGPRFVFREEENPHAKLLAYAKNDKLFADGRDKARLLRLVRFIIGGSEAIAKKFHIIVLGPDWTTNPWQFVPEEDLFPKWDHRIRYVIVPAPTERQPSELLGPWLKEHLQKKRNTLRFVLPPKGTQNIYTDEDVIQHARAIQLADEWKATERVYKDLQKKHEEDLTKLLEKRFNTIAILLRWDYQNPGKSKFRSTSRSFTITETPVVLDDFIRNNWNPPEEYETFVVRAAKDRRTMGYAMQQLQEPRPPENDCITWLGEEQMTLRMLKICAEGSIAISAYGKCHLQKKKDEDENTALARMKKVIEPEDNPGRWKMLNESTLTLPLDEGIIGPDTDPDPPSSTPPKPPPPTKLVPRISTNAKSPLNLLGQMEGWGIAANTEVQSVVIKVQKLRGEQLIELVKRLPDGATYELSVNTVELLTDEEKAEAAKTEADK